MLRIVNKIFQATRVKSSKFRGECLTFFENRLILKRTLQNVYFSFETGRMPMPPKPKFSRDEIVATALQIVSEKGVEALTAKELGDALGSSARPIFTVFRSMKEVQDAVRAAAMRRFESFAEQRMPDMPLFKQVGMQMVLFGAREPKLYQLLFMQENRNAVQFEDVFSELGPTANTCIALLQAEYALTEAEARMLFENVWIYTFGVGALCATRVCHFSEEALGQMLSTEFSAMMQLIKSRQACAQKIKGDERCF